MIHEAGAGPVRSTEQVERFCTRSDSHSRSMRRKNGLYITRLEFRRARFAKNVYLVTLNRNSFFFTPPNVFLDFLARDSCYASSSLFFFFFPFINIFYFIPF